MFFIVVEKKIVVHPWLQARISNIASSLIPRLYSYYSHSQFFQRTYHPHCVIIHARVPVLITTGPANPAPHLAVPNTNHSVTKCPKATPYVHSANWYISGSAML